MSLNDDNERWYRGTPLLDENKFGYYLISWGNDRRVSKAIYANQAHLCEDNDYGADVYRNDGDPTDPQYTGWFICEDLYGEDLKEVFKSLPDGLVQGYRYLPQSPF